MAAKYDPFARGLFPVGVRTIEAIDQVRDRRFPVEIWYPAAARHAGQDTTPKTQDTYAARTAGPQRKQMAVRNATVHPARRPLLLFSHPSGSDRRSATFLCTHLASHGYIVAAMDHSERVAPELAPKPQETDIQRDERTQAWIESRVPDIRFLMDLLVGADTLRDIQIDPQRVGIIGHSFGGWTALAAPEVEPRIRAVVALAPGGSSHPKPGILKLRLSFQWAQDVPTLYSVAENDISLPLTGMYELFERTPGTKQMVILSGADHLHFMDHVEEEHETVRSMKFSGALSWISDEMRPISELCSGARAHLFARGLTLAHMDAVLRDQPEAHHFLRGDLETELRDRGVSARLGGTAT